MGFADCKIDLQVGEKMSVSKSQLDKAGIILTRNLSPNELSYLNAESILDAWRREHLTPLTEITLKLQDWLRDFGKDYYLAQRLKRRPQIVRKLSRLSVRLSQLQDVGGCRIILESNTNVDEFIRFIDLKVKKTKYFSILRQTDYRAKGRDSTGYRAVHLILERNELKVELQLRSNIQHYWCESIERTSVIYGQHLKEGQGDNIVIKYFKLTSDAFHELERGQRPSDHDTNEIDRLKVQAEAIIRESDTHNVFSSRVNNDFIRAMISRESATRTNFNNWTVVFNWKEGRFMSWELTERDPTKAVMKYSEYEKQWPATDGYEVVMIGSSNVATVQKTHSHYFGIESYDSILESLDDSQVAFAKRSQLASLERQVIQRLVKYNNWNQNKVSIETLKNHYFRDIFDLELHLEALLDRGFVIQEKKGGPVSLNMKQKNEIMKCI